MKRDIAVAYSVKRKAKKMAKGGDISAATESRPSPETRGNDKAETARNSEKHGPMRGDSMKQDDISYEAKRGPKTTRIKHPSMVPGSTFTARLRDQEDDLEMSAAPSSPTEEPSKWTDEKDAKKHGTAPHKMKMMAKGGMAKEYGRGPEDDQEEHPAHLEDDNDMMRPDEDEIMADHMEMLAEGGMAHEMDEQPLTEEEIEHAASLASAIMAKRRKMAEGGEVDLSINADEEPNHEDDLSFEALKKENYSESEGLDAIDQPEDSNEHSPEHEAMDDHDGDLVSQIRRKMKIRSPITR